MLAEHHIRERVRDYPLVVIPEWRIIDEGVRELLIDYAKDRGSPLLIGAQTTLMFRDYLGVEFIGEPAKEVAYVRSQDVLGWLGSTWQSVKLLSVKCIGVRFFFY